MKKRKNDALSELIAAASHKVLSKLILELAAGIPDVRRECFDFLKSNVTISKALEKRYQGEAIQALWSELGLILSELDSYGGGDHATEDRVAELLDQVRIQLDSKKVGSEHRSEILHQVLPYIKSGNAGMDDMLYEVAYAACYNDADLRNLAEAFEAMGGDWQLTQARGIYRRIGDREKYLDLRQKSMVYGGDYHDLAEFYWESGDKENPCRWPKRASAKGRDEWMSCADSLPTVLKNQVTANGTWHFNSSRPLTG